MLIFARVISGDPINPDKIGKYSVNEQGIICSKEISDNWDFVDNDHHCIVDRSGISELNIGDVFEVKHRYN